MFRAQRVAGRFQLEEEAAKGGMGTVFRALDLKTHKRVAVKVLRRREVVSAARFVREAAVLAELSHPGIVQYISSGRTSDGLHFIVMEWVEGETLAHKLERDGLTIADTVTVGIHLADALAAAHARGMVHRDIKPTNLMFVTGEIDKLKVLDFGIARRAHEPGEITQTGVMVGTMGYMSPEQARGTRAEKIDPRVDVFALGCVLYECLAGRPTFVGDNMMAVRAKILYADPPGLAALAPEAPPALIALVGAMLAKQPGPRPADGVAVREALRALGPMPASKRRAPRHDEAPPTEPPLFPWARQSLEGSTTSPEAPACVVLISSPLDNEDEEDDSQAEIEPRDMEDEVKRLAPVVARFGGAVESLGEGSLIVTLAASGDLEAQAHNAARCALALKPLVPGATLSVATEHTDTEPAIGKLLDRGARTLGLGMASIHESLLDLAQEPEAAIWLDDETARLVRPKFDLKKEPAGYRLLRER